MQRLQLEVKLIITIYSNGVPEPFTGHGTASVAIRGVEEHNKERFIGLLMLLSNSSYSFLSKIFRINQLLQCRYMANLTSFYFVLP